MISSMTSKRTPEPGITPEDWRGDRMRHRVAAMHEGTPWRQTPEGVRLLLHGSHEPGLIIEEVRFVDCNRAALKLLGFERKDQLIGMHPSDCSPRRQPDGRLSFEKAEDIIASTLVSGSSRFEWHHVRKDAKIVPVEVTVTKLYLNGREALYTSWRDLTRQKSLETALSESKQALREVFEQSEDPIILLSPATWRIIDANSSMVRLYGYSKKLLLEQGLPLFMEPTERTRFMETVRTGNKDGDVHLDRARHFAHDGRELFVATKCRPISFHSEALLCCRFRNITDELLLQRETNLIQGKLIHANRLTSLGTLVSSVAHEINNPNNFIMLNGSLLQEAWADVAHILEDYARERGDLSIAGLPLGEMKDAMGKLISGVIDGSRRINCIVDSLKEFSRQPQKSFKNPMNANTIVRMAASILCSQIKKHTNRFTLDLDENIPEILGNSQQLEQVVINLILNALQALPEKGRSVRVASRLDKRRRSVIISIEDEGNGMSAEVLDRIKEPFFSTRLDSGGTGLGVFISHAIITDHNGSLTYESKEGRGTVATISLPAVDETSVN